MRRFAATVLLPALAAGPTFSSGSEDRASEGPSVTVIGGVDVGRWYNRSKAAPLYGVQFGHDWQANTLVYGTEGEAARATNRHCFTVRQTNGGEDR